MKTSCFRAVFYILLIPIPGQSDISSRILHWNINFHGFFDDTCSSHEELSSCIDAIDDLCAKRPDYYELSVKGHLFHFFYLLFSSHGSPVTFSRSKSLDKVKQIVSYIESHYTEPITVQSAADYMGFSESHFMKFFKQHLHTTFTSYLNGYRLTIAARLLLTEDDSILSISERTGFNNLSYFNRLFKKDIRCHRENTGTVSKQKKNSV